VARRELDAALQRYELERAANDALRKQARTTTDSPSPLAAAVFFLSSARSAGADAEPLNRITLLPDQRWVILSIDVELEHETLRATLSDASGKALWEQTGLRTVARQALGLILPSSLFQTGDYILKLEALTRDRPAGVIRYRFRAVASPGR